MGVLDKIKEWQAQQLEQGEARYERLKARADELEAQQAAQRAARPAPEPKAARPPKVGRASFKGEGGQLVLRQGELRYSGTGGRTTVPLDSVQRVAVEDGTEFRRRSTLTRTGGGALAGGLLFGPVGLLAGMGLGAVATKKEGGERYLTVETTTAAFAVQVPRDQVPDAQKFAAALRTAVAQVQ